MGSPHPDERSGNWEDTLIERFSSGEEAAFTQLYNAYKHRIFNYIYKMMPDSGAAEDLTQETFINVYLNIRRYNPMGFFKAWIYKIATNLTRNELYRRRNRNTVSLNQPIGDDPAGPTLEDLLSSEKFSPERISENRELKERIEKALAFLPDKYREVLILCVIEELTYEEAASALNTNVKTVSTRLVRAREMLMKKIGSLEKGV